MYCIGRYVRLIGSSEQSFYDERATNQTHNMHDEIIWKIGAQNNVHYVILIFIAEMIRRQPSDIQYPFDSFRIVSFCIQSVQRICECDFVVNPACIWWLWYFAYDIQGMPVLNSERVVQRSESMFHLSHFCSEILWKIEIKIFIKQNFILY